MDRQILKYYRPFKNIKLTFRTLLADLAFTRAERRLVPVGVRDEARLAEAANRGRVRRTDGWGSGELCDLPA